MSDNIDLVTTSGDSEISVVATPTSETDSKIEPRQCIPLSAILKGLQAVGSALKLPDDQTRTIVEVVTADHDKHVEDLPLEGWLQATRLVAFNRSQQQIVNVAIALAFLRESGRQGVVVSRLIFRSAQGLHAIPLWSLIEDGRIDELIRLHVWLPDAVRADPDFAIHMHQPFAQSWILAGEGTDHIFDVNPADEGNATHAEYTVGWKETDNKKSDRIYKVHSKSSTVTNTGKLVCIVPRQAELHTRNMSYHIPAGVFHKSEVEPDALHATILFFDSHRGYIHDAPVIGPISWEPSTHDRKPANINVDYVAAIIEDLRRWEVLHQIGLRHSDLGEWEEALRSYRTALHVCKNNEWLDLPRYSHVTLGKIGHMYRMLGLYDQACNCLEEAVIDTPLSQCRVDCTGELATVYRHMDRLEDSKRASEDQYHAAKKLNLEKCICRAVGTLGMVNYQLFLVNQDLTLLESAINQLDERVKRAQQLEDVVLEAIGHGRLSLCYVAKGNYEKAIHSAQKNYDLMCMQHDATKIGFARAFFGRALLLAGRKEEALALFNPPYGCPPIIALCKEISDEHRQYIIEMIHAGADLKIRDEQSYSALECAVYNGDNATANIIKQGLRAQISLEGGDVDQELTQFQYEATLRKGYRDIFQDRLRPVLLGTSEGSTLRTLRQTYAASLANDPEKQNTFDRLKYVPYADFLRCGRLPRSNDGYTKDYTGDKLGQQDPFILFLSYRWISKDPGVHPSGFSPDDDVHTQYKRMLRAIEQFLHLHHDVDQDRLCIWLDFACVDQDYQKPGVAALPMNLAQCNAMISLIDEKYYERSWCCVEVLMIQTLRNAYGVHTWYEHVIDPVDADECLRTGPWEMEVRMSEKQVTYESDRPKLQFLERQTALLG